MPFRFFHKLILCDTITINGFKTKILITLNYLDVFVYESNRNYYPLKVQSPGLRLWGTTAIKRALKKKHFVELFFARTLSRLPGLIIIKHTFTPPPLRISVPKRPLVSNRTVKLQRRTVLAHKLLPSFVNLLLWIQVFNKRL